MINAILNGILNVLIYLVDLVTTPIDTAISALFPNLSTDISTAINGVISMFANLSWPLSILPNSFITILLIIFGMHLVFLAFMAGATAVVKAINVFGKVKFW